MGDLGAPGAPVGVAVVVVAYGSPDDLGRALAALGGAFDVVVVDNSSSASVRAVAEEAGAAYRDPGENLGFGAGVNLALGSLDLEHRDVLLLNPDAAVSPQEVTALQRQLRASADVACVAPAQRHPESGAEVPVRWPWATPARAWFEAVGLGRFRRRWDFVSASILLVRGEALRQLGGFDERFFLYGEEADWERRATRAGWRVEFSPRAVAWHRGAATDADPDRHRLRFHAGVECYVRKWHGPLGWRSYQAASVLTALRRAARGGGRQASLALARLYLRGPYATARRAGVVPARSTRIPRLS